MVGLQQDGLLPKAKSAATPVPEDRSGAASQIVSLSKDSHLTKGRRRGHSSPIQKCFCQSRGEDEDGRFASFSPPHSVEMRCETGGLRGEDVRQPRKGRQERRPRLDSARSLPRDCSLEMCVQMGNPCRQARERRKNVCSSLPARSSRKICRRAFTVGTTVCSVLLCTRSRSESRNTRQEGEESRKPQAPSGSRVFLSSFASPLRTTTITTNMCRV